MITTKECQMCRSGFVLKQEDGFITTGKCEVCNGTGYLGDPPPPKPEPTCATCRFWLQAMKDAGHCLRYPPPTLDGTGWPPVYASNWCGEYQPKPSTRAPDSIGPFEPGRIFHSIVHRNRGWATPLGDDELCSVENELRIVSAVSEEVARLAKEIGDHEQAMACVLREYKLILT